MRELKTTIAYAAIVATMAAGHALAGDYSDAWYDQPPLLGTGPGLYYSYHPEHVPGYPTQFRGYPIPLYDIGRRTSATVGDDAHVQWCYGRWRSYRASDNTYQPLLGTRRECVSPYL